jgi:RNA polymerase sigma-70 factor (ECF subfamily)
MGSIETVDEHDRLAERFEAHRGRLRAVAYRMLGSASEADDAVQEAWLRLSRLGPDDVARIDSLEGWLRTVVARLCLDMLRTRRSRREEPLTRPASAPGLGDDGFEDEVVLVESVGRAMLVVLDQLGPAERVAFVLHDLFAVPFDQIAPIVERTPLATKKLASRARRRVRGGEAAAAIPSVELGRQRRVVEAFLVAARAGDLEALLAVLAPDAVRRADRAVLSPGRPTVAQGAETVAREIQVLGRRARFAELALVDGRVGLVVAPHGHLTFVITFAVTAASDRVAAGGDRVAAYDVVADPTRLRRLDLALPTALDPNAPAPDPTA